MLAIGVVIAGWLLSGGIRHFKDTERVVTVKGLAEKEVMADRVIWPLSYKEVGNDMLALYNTMESANAKIVEFLKSNGIAETEIPPKSSTCRPSAMCPRACAIAIT